MFWGLIDQRLDISFIEKLAIKARRLGGKVVLVGPQQHAHKRLHELSGQGPNGSGIPSVVMTGEIKYQDLPVIARAADVLVMPYIDAPVTRAMQPLKLKEYLATAKPVVCRDLPSIKPWANACDIASNVDDFVNLAVMRYNQRISKEQKNARKRLENESWREKSKQLLDQMFCETKYAQKKASSSNHAVATAKTKIASEAA